MDVLVNSANSDEIRFGFTCNVVPLVIIGGVENDTGVHHPVRLVAGPVRVLQPVAGLPPELPVAIHVGQTDPSILYFIK
jgi:hypothetical protein